MISDKNIKEQRRQRTDGVRARNMQKQRQVMIQRAIALGSFDDREQVKSWLKTEFHLPEKLEEVSTEYSLTDNQLRLWYVWLRYFTGQGKKPRRHVARSKAGPRRLWRIEQLQKALGWDQFTLLDFIERQVKKRKLPQSLYGNEAHKVITGMDRILAERPFKRKHQLHEDKK